MNAADIWPGSEYAIALAGKPRNATFVKGCVRIRVLRVYKENNSYYAKRGTSYVDCFRLTREGEPDPNYPGISTGLRAYDVVDHWDDYEDQLQEYEVREAERRKVAEVLELQRREEYIKRQAEMQARREKEQQERLALLEKQAAQREEILLRLERRGINRNYVTVSQYTVAITTAEVLRWLNIGQDDS